MHQMPGVCPEGMLADGTDSYIISTLVKLLQLAVLLLGSH